jgi:hypothetical protein
LKEAEEVPSEAIGQLLAEQNVVAAADLTIRSWRIKPD